MTPLPPSILTRAEVARENNESYQSEKKLNTIIAGSFICVAILAGLFGILVAARIINPDIDRILLADPLFVVFYVAVVVGAAVVGLHALAEALVRRPLVILSDAVVLPRRRRSGLHLEEHILRVDDVVSMTFHKIHEKGVFVLRSRDGRAYDIHLGVLDRPDEATSHLMAILDAKGATTRGDGRAE